MMHYDAIIIGGGPAGCATARNIAGQGFSVLVVEEHERIGEPVRCSGLISPRTVDISGVSDSVVINELKGARVFSPRGGQLNISSDKVKAVAIDRVAFDRAIADQAMAAGADIMPGARAKGIERLINGFRVMVERKGVKASLNTRLLIGADGVNSQVAKWLNLRKSLHMARMYAADVELSREAINNVDIFMGHSVAPGWFGWVIPLDGRRCRVGTGFTYAGEHSGNRVSPMYCFQQMVTQFPAFFKGMKILRYTGGVVPFGITPKIFASNAMLVGDAAVQTKPISGGGIYFGLIGAEMCARVATYALNQDNLSERVIGKYQKLWEKKFGREIRCCTGYRELYTSFSDDDIDSLLRFLNQPYWQGVISRYGDIDYPSWLARQLVSLGPWVQRFMKAAMAVSSYGSNFKQSFFQLL